MMTFKVGDKIRGTSDNHIVLDARMKLAEVIELFKVLGSTEGMVIKIIEHTDKTKIGLKYWVYNLDIGFELVEEKKMNKLEELEMKVKELSEEIERLKAEKENETGKLEHGDVYWFINHIGEIKLATWYGDPEDKTRYELGNVFIERWEASFKLEQLKVEAELKRFSRPFVVDKANFMLRYDHDRNEILLEDFGFIQFSNIYFPSKKIAQKAIDTVGEERIKKYYFGVNE